MGIELVLPHPRTPSVEKKKRNNYYTGIQLVLPQSRTPAVACFRLMDYRTRNIHVFLFCFHMQIFIDCRTAGAEH